MDFLDFLTSVASKPQEMKVVKNAQTSVIPFLCPECDKMFIIVDRPKAKKYICPHCSKAITPKVITADNAPTAEPAK